MGWRGRQGEGKGNGGEGKAGGARVEGRVGGGEGKSVVTASLQVGQVEESVQRETDQRRRHSVDREPCDVAVVYFALNCLCCHRSLHLHRLLLPPHHIRITALTLPPASPCEQLVQHHPVAVHVCGCSPARNVRVVPALQHCLHDYHTKGCSRLLEECQAVRCHAQQQGMRSCKAACAAASEVAGNLAQPPQCRLRCQKNHVEAFSLCRWARCTLRTPHTCMCSGAE